MKARYLESGDFFQFPGEEELRYCISKEIIPVGDGLEHIRVPMVIISYPINKAREIEANAEIKVIRLNL
jgi:hypothetical protein